MNIKWYKMLINQSNLHNYFSEFKSDDEKAEEKIHEDLRIIAMTCVSRKISLEWEKN